MGRDGGREGRGVQAARLVPYNLIALHCRSRWKTPRIRRKRKSHTAPTNVLIVIRHILDNARHIRLAGRSGVAAELGDHCFEIVLLEPLGQAVKVGRCWVGAWDVVAGEVDVKVFVDVDCEVVC